MTVWRIVAHHSHPEIAISEIRALGEIALGWNLVGDLKSFSSAKEISEATKTHYPDLANAPYSGPQLWNFSWELKVGDLVIVTSGERRALVVKVTGEYFYEEGKDPTSEHYMHRRSVAITEYDPDALWTSAAGVAEGQGIRWAFVRCQREVSAAEAARFLRTSVATVKGKAVATRAPRAVKEVAVVPPEQKMIVLNVGTHLFEFTAHGIYTCPSGPNDFRPDHTHQPARYAGIYYSKGIPAIAEIDAVVRLTSDTAGSVLWKFSKVADDKLVADAVKRRSEAINPVKEEMLHKAPCLVFLFANKRRTELIYGPHGGLIGARQYISLADMKFESVDELADQLRKYNWTSLPKLKI